MEATMILVAILSILGLLFNMFYIVREIYFFFKDVENKIKHKHDYISVFVNLLVLSVGYLFWIFTHKGLEHGFYEHLINQSMWIGNILFSITIHTICQYSLNIRLENK